MTGEPPDRVLVTGGAGHVAGWFVRTAPPGVDLHVTEHRTPVPDEVRARVRVHRVDLEDADATKRCLDAVRPDVVLHTAYAQSRRAAIVDATASVAAAAAATGAAVVHQSTDVVFAGDRPPYAEDDPVDPISEYGRWKAASEVAARAVVPDLCTTRTSLVVATDPPDRSTAALAAALRTGEEVRLFHDELRQPIRSDDLAAELWALVALDREDRAGTWHLPGPEHLSRLELGRRLAASLGLDASGIVAASAASFPTPRARDPFLVGERRSALGVALRPVGA